MTSRKMFVAALATTALACAATVTPLVLPTPLAAQVNPTKSNVIPDGGRFAIKGKVQAIDPAANTINIATEFERDVAAGRGAWCQPGRYLGW